MERDSEVAHDAGPFDDRAGLPEVLGGLAPALGVDHLHALLEQALRAREIHFETVPADARISEGETQVTDGIARLSRDGSEHVFLVEAPGRAPQRVRVAADQDRTVRVSLRRSGTGSPPSTTATHRTDIAREF